MKSFFVNLFSSKSSKAMKEMDRDKILGLRCKSCGEKITDKQRWGKETLCFPCEFIMNDITH